jgi:uncharacterized protein YegP (UPF0339 family)
MYFTKWKSSTGWRWNLKAANNEIVASGEGYVYESGCDNAINLVKGTNTSTPVRNA